MCQPSWCERHGSELGESFRGHAHRENDGAGGEIGLGKWGGLRRERASRVGSMANRPALILDAARVGEGY